MVDLKTGFVNKMMIDRIPETYKSKMESLNN